MFDIISNYISFIFRQDIYAFGIIITPASEIHDYLKVIPSILFAYTINECKTKDERRKTGLRKKEGRLIIDNE